MYGEKALVYREDDGGLFSNKALVFARRDNRGKYHSGVK
jgi:hypothetical protein